MYLVSANVLNILQRPVDLENTTTLGQIEKKLHLRDRLKWAAQQRKEPGDPSVEKFTKWLEDELWIRQFAGAEIRRQKPAMKSAVDMTLADTSPEKPVVCAATTSRF